MFPHIFFYNSDCLQHTIEKSGEDLDNDYLFKEKVSFLEELRVGEVQRAAAGKRRI